VAIAIRISAIESNDIEAENAGGILENESQGVPLEVEDNNSILKKTSFGGKAFQEGKPTHC